LHVHFPKKCRPSEVSDAFEVPDFVVGTSSGSIVRVSSESIEQKSSIGKRGFLLVKGFESSVTALDAHPNLPLLSTGSERFTTMGKYFVNL
jgi:hypothetical protein